MDRERERGKARESERGGKRRGGGGGRELESVFLLKVSFLSHRKN